MQRKPSCSSARKFFRSKANSVLLKHFILLLDNCLLLFLIHIIILDNHLGRLQIVCVNILFSFKSLTLCDTI